MRFIGILTLLSLLPLSAAAGTVVETFDGKDLEDWQELNVHDAFPGTWKILDGELEGITPGGAARFLITGDETWQNYSIQVDVMPLKKMGPGKIGIAARGKGTWIFWCRITDLNLNRPKSDVACSSRNVHEAAGLVFYIAPHRLLKLNEWSQLNLRVDGDHFIFSINGKKIVETGDPFNFRHEGQEIKWKAGDLSDHPIGAGGAGFGFSNYIVRFDNITITGKGIPDKGGLSVRPKEKLATTWGELKRF